MNIIDISHHQDPSKINYDKLAKQVDLVIIRTQYGSRTLDRHYKTHHAEFKKRGVPCAAYAWIRGSSISDMEVEATDFYNRTKDLEPVFWFLDVEEKSMNDMRSGVSAYIKKLRSLGAKKIGVYIANHLYKSFDLDFSEADAVWIPHYGTNDGQINSTPKYSCDLHQYTSVGRLDGYDGNLDLNRLLNGKNIEFFIGETVSETELIIEQPQPSKTLLSVDGDWGEKTTRELQLHFGTPVDGEISKPSLLIKAIQRIVGAHVDGYLGEQTISKMQIYLGTPVDGKISKPSLMVKEMQRRLNEGRF